MWWKWKVCAYIIIEWGSISKINWYVCGSEWTPQRKWILYCVYQIISTNCQHRKLKGERMKCNYSWPRTQDLRSCKFNPIDSCNIIYVWNVFLGIYLKKQLEYLWKGPLVNKERKYYASNIFETAEYKSMYLITMLTCT